MSWPGRLRTEVHAMTELDPPPSQDDVCSFHGGARSEQTWHCRQMFGGPLHFICEECLLAAVTALEGAPDRPLSVDPTAPVCDFCRVRPSDVAGPDVFICADCVAAMVALRGRPMSPWCAVLTQARQVNDVLAVLALFDTHGPALRAGGVSLRDFMQGPRYLGPDVPRRGLDSADLREILCWRLLDWMTRVSSEPWNRVDQDRLYQGWTTRDRDTRRFVERCRAAGIDFEE